MWFRCFRNRFRTLRQIIYQRHLTNSKCFFLEKVCLCFIFGGNGFEEVSTKKLTVTSNGFLAKQIWLHRKNIIFKKPLLIFCDHNRRIWNSMFFCNFFSGLSLRGRRKFLFRLRRKKVWNPKKLKKVPPQKRVDQEK